MASPTAGRVPLTVNFRQDSAPLAQDIRWDFGDGSTSNERHPVHTYAVLGTYTATLTVTTFGKSYSSSQVIAVNTVPVGFVDEKVFRTKLQTTGVIVMDEDDFLTWSKDGTVWRWSSGAYCTSPMADISEEVGNWGDHGLIRVLLDPDYMNNGFVYFLYVVDRYYLDNFGLPGYDPALSSPQTETIARLTRYTVLDPTDPETVIDPASRLDLLGATLADGLPICATSHGVGGMEFGHDGSLVLSVGDAWLGDTFQAECLTLGVLNPRTSVRSFRAQLPDSPNGKVLRIDPTTGEGHPTNPFFDAQAPRAWSSRVWALGFRNPYSFAIRPDPPTGQFTHGSGLHPGAGVVYVADVGAEDWEELNVVEYGGENFGFPLWAGMKLDPFWNLMNTQNLDAPNPLFGMSGCNEPFFRFEDLLVEDTLNLPTWPNRCNPSLEIPGSIARFVHERPVVTWLHDDQPGAPMTLVPGFDSQGEAVALSIDDASSSVLGTPFPGNTAIAGTWFSGGSFPRPFDDVLFVADYGEKWIRAFEFDSEHQLAAIHDFANSLGNVMFVTEDPEERSLYYLKYSTTDRGLYRISYELNAQPLAEAQATPVFGPAPLRVQLSALGSSDPEGTALSYAWDFGDGEPRSPLHTWPDPVHVYPSEDITAGARAITSATETPLSTGRSPGTVSRRGTAPVESPQPLLPEISDGVYGPEGSAGAALQVTSRGNPPWIGYRNSRARNLVALIYQEGLNTGVQGGTLSSPVVETFDDLDRVWKPVPNLQLARPLPGDPNIAYQTFHFSFDPVRASAIRLRETQPSAGEGRFTTAELRLFALPEPFSSSPASSIASVVVSDSDGLTSQADVLVSVNNTPPVASITSPTSGQIYPVGVASTIPMTSAISDAEHGAGELSCSWIVELVHDNHTHPEPPDTACSTSILLQPHSELQGNIIYWRFTLTVTDDAGLATEVSRDLIPAGDCNLNGIDDLTDILVGTSLDLNMNGIPDECE